MKVIALPLTLPYPQNEILNEQLEEACPRCDRYRVLWQERILIQGSLQSFHLIHTEVEDIYKCRSCRYSWSRWKIL